MPKRAPLTTPDWQACDERSRSAAVQRRTQFYLLVVRNVSLDAVPPMHYSFFEQVVGIASNTCDILEIRIVITLVCI